MNITEKKERKKKERKEKSHLPFSHCEKHLRDQIKNLFSKDEGE